MVRSNGDFVTQRQCHKMALVQTEVRGDGLVIEAAGMPTLTLPLCPMTDRSFVMKCRLVRACGTDTDTDAD